MPTLNLQQLAEITGARLEGDPAQEVSGVNQLDHARSHELTFLNAKAYRPLLPNTQAGVVILAEADLAACPVAALVSDNPYLAYARAAKALSAEPPAPAGIHPSAVVAASAELGEGVSVGPNCCIGEYAKLADGVDLGPNCVVGDNCQIGARSQLWANVSVLKDCQMGADCVIQSGTVIGSDGFGMANDNGAWVKVPQLGRVVLGNGVEIGANCAIDRGAVEDTVLADGVMLDNLVHIAHNVKVGQHTAIAAGVGIAGSTEIGAYCTFAGLAGVSGHLKLADHVHIAAMTGVAGSITEPGVYTSTLTALPHDKWRRNFVRIRQLDDMAKRLKKLEKRLAEVEPDLSE